MTEENTPRGNTAFIDGQNLHLSTQKAGWAIDYKKLRVYLYEKYNITEAYYFLGYINDKYKDIYKNLQEADYILSFRDHSESIASRKKGNVDSDIVFTILKRLITNPEPEMVYIISGDGDYIKLTQFLIKRNMFGKILFPSKLFASSLYKKLGTEYFDYLDDKNIRAKIEDE